ncbi:MAG: HAD-IIIC family phosphatase [Candidatus Falkowbacteria bacterium]
MKNLNEYIKSRQPRNLSDFLILHKNILEKISKEQCQADKKIKIALLSSFTAKGLPETLFVKCCESGVMPEIYVSDYNQYAQEILNRESGLYSFASDLVILFIDTKILMGELFFSPYMADDRGRKELAEEKTKEILSLLNALRKNSSAKILVHNFEVPYHSPLGIADNKQKFGWRESIRFINDTLQEFAKNNNQIYLFDFDAFTGHIGKENAIDHKMYYLADVKFSWKYIPRLCDEYMAYIKAMLGVNRKCLVLDLDNTLWGGVIGEDGMGGIKLGPYPEGRPFWEMQKYILSLFRRGIILAINSKNNPEDVAKVFSEHPYMVLKEKHFASMRVNWNDKATNLKAIAEEINIGIDSLVFLDDDKLNRDLVKSLHPEALVVDMPDDSALYLKTLMEINDFNVWNITEEDMKRGEMYAGQRERNKFMGSVSNIDDYLTGLEMEVSIEGVDENNIPRIAQLTQKTNQFNLTTRRYSEEDIARMATENYLIAAISVKDKFGDNGITGVVIVGRKTESLSIDSFLLSCRIIGRRVENAILAYLVKIAGEAGAKTIIGEYIPTAKNLPAKDFFRNSGFVLIKKKNSGGELYQYDITKSFLCPGFIKLIIKK